uniref:Uncharacterized protein n=1 Tax=Lactuca sativa TaxID=4236 RepID=A0A9R1UC83_LACSA|nr:hypothetical protein LSAT_V11C900458130 [Lactuca sativa]
MNDDSDDELVLNTLLSMAQNMVRERCKSSYSEKKHRKWINRDREAENELLVCDYFAPDSLYNLSKFEERFRISRNSFLRIARDLERNYEFFQLQWDARGKSGFTTIQNCTTAFRQLGYRTTADASDEYLKMSESTGQECTYLFCECVIELYRDIYVGIVSKAATILGKYLTRLCMILLGCLHHSNLIG